MILRILQNKKFQSQMKKIKLIWDFKGLDAHKIAAHHEIHLKDYIKMKHTDLNITGIEQLSDLHSLAYMVVNESEMKPIRDDLKPHRGQLWQS